MSRVIDRKYIFWLISHTPQPFGIKQVKRFKWSTLSAIALTGGVDTMIINA